MGEGEDSINFHLLLTSILEWDDRKALRSIIVGAKPDILLIEQFRIRHDTTTVGKGDIVWSSVIIGRIEQINDELDLPIYYQEPSDRQPKRTKILDQHKHMLKSTHLRAAYQHLRIFLAKINFNKLEIKNG